MLAEARRRAHLEPRAGWPPVFFSFFASGRTDLGAHHDGLLAYGFAR